MQEREYKEALDEFNNKNKEKVQLVTRLMEVGVIFRNQDHKWVLCIEIDMTG